MYYSVFRMEYNMTDSELASLFNDLAEVLGDEYTNIAAANGETILLNVYSWTCQTFCTRQCLTNLIYFVYAERDNLTTPPPPPYVEPPRPEPRQSASYVEPRQPAMPLRKCTKLLCYFINYTVNTCV